MKWIAVYTGCFGVATVTSGSVLFQGIHETCDVDQVYGGNVTFWVSLYIVNLNISVYALKIYSLVIISLA